MEKIVFNGDLFIKYTPTIINQRIYDKDEKLFDINIEELDKESIENALLLFANKMDEILSSKEYEIKRIEDYSNNVGFYCLSFNDDKIKLTSESNIVDTIVYNEESGISMNRINIFYEFDSIDDVGKHFVPLSTFLDKATYMGFDLKSGEDVIRVLYEYLDTYFIINSMGKYTVISKHHPVLKKYTKVNSFQDSYDKKCIHLKLIKQRLTNDSNRHPK